MLLAAAAVFLTLGVMTPALVQRHVRLSTDVILEDVLLPGGRSLLRPVTGEKLLPCLVEGAFSVLRVAGRQEDLKIHLRAKNRTFVSGSLVTARYSIAVGDREIGSGEWTADQPIPFRAGGEAKLELALRPDSLEVLDSLLRTAAGEEPAIRAHGQIVIDLGSFGRLELPFEVRQVSVELG